MNKIVKDIQTKYEPKKQDRFTVTLPEYFNIPSYFIYEVQRPKLSPYVVYDTKRESKCLIDDITLKIYDPIGPSSSQALMKLFIDDKNKPLIYQKFDFFIELLDSTGIVIEKWVLSNCLIKSIDFGSLSHQESNILTCKLIISIGDVELLF